jgi:RNA recognition motif-containing protein
VVRGSNGESRGYAFVNFSNESDYKDALTHMQGHRGLGSNPLRVSLAIPRNYNMIPGKCTLKLFFGVHFISYSFNF